MLKGIIEKLFKPEQKPTQSEAQSISQEEVEALISAKLKEHAAAIESSIKENTPKEHSQEDNKLTAKQIDYALSLIAKLNGEYILAVEPSDLTLKDLNRLIGYNRYKNIGILVNLAKKRGSEEGIACRKF